MRLRLMRELEALKADGKILRAPDENRPELVHERLPPLNAAGPAQRASPTQGPAQAAGYFQGLR